MKSDGIPCVNADHIYKNSLRLNSKTEHGIDKRKLMKYASSFPSIKKISKNQEDPALSTQIVRDLKQSRNSTRIVLIALDQSKDLDNVNHEEPLFTSGAEKVNYGLLEWSNIQVQLFHPEALFSIRGVSLI